MNQCIEFYSYSGDEEQLQHLIADGVDYRNTVIDSDGRPAMHMAAQRGKQTHSK